jgi:hypothetical protein
VSDFYCGTIEIIDFSLFFFAFQAERDCGAAESETNNVFLETSVTLRCDAAAVATSALVNQSCDLVASASAPDGLITEETMNTARRIFVQLPSETIVTMSEASATVASGPATFVQQASEMLASAIAPIFFANG